jgi:purine-binding chemotaxis protein CheW
MSEMFVLFRVGDPTYAVPASSVIQMETYTGATRIPRAPSHVPGVVQVRGAVVPVVDLRLRFGVPVPAPTLDTRIIVIESNGRRVALLVDSAREVAQLDAASFAPPPDVVSTQSGRFVKAIGRHGDRLVMWIDDERVIGEEDLHGNDDANG